MKKYDLSKITKKLNLSSKFNKIDVVKNRRKLILIRNIFNKNKENDIYRELKYCKKTTSICNNLYEKISNLLFFK